MIYDDNFISLSRDYINMEHKLCQTSYCLNGYTIYPLTFYPNNNFTLDGCVIEKDTLPFGSIVGHNLGKQ